MTLSRPLRGARRADPTPGKNGALSFLTDLIAATSLRSGLNGQLVALPQALSAFEASLGMLARNTFGHTHGHRRFGSRDTSAARDTAAWSSSWKDLQEVSSARVAPSKKMLLIIQCNCFISNDTIVLPKQYMFRSMRFRRA